MSSKTTLLSGVGRTILKSPIDSDLNLVLSIVRGVDCEIYEENQMIHVVGGENGGKFDVDGIVVIMNSDGSWSLKAGVLVRDVNDVYKIIKSRRRIRFDKLGTPLNLTPEIHVVY